MHTACIITKFPFSYILDTIAKKLAKKDIKVQKILHPSKVSKAIHWDNYDLIFIMQEFLSHSEHDRIRSFLAIQDRTFNYLSRKSSGWNFDHLIAPLQFTSNFLNKLGKLSNEKP